MARPTTKLDSKKVVSTAISNYAPLVTCTFIHRIIQNAELFTLTYGALVTKLLKDYENVDDVNKQLDRMGYNIGVRLIEDFLARTNTGRCHDLRDTADKIQVRSQTRALLSNCFPFVIIFIQTRLLQTAFRTYLGVTPQISNWTAANDEFSLLFESNPLTEFVELPDHCLNLKYSNIFAGIIRGACEMVCSKYRIA